MTSPTRTPLLRFAAALFASSLLSTGGPALAQTTPTGTLEGRVLNVAAATYLGQARINHVGTYEFENRPDRGFIVTLKGDQLLGADGGPKMALFPKAEGRYFLQSGCSAGGVRGGLCGRH